jgi:hypothetical protein
MTDNNKGISADANKLENGQTVTLTSYLRQQALSRVPQRTASCKSSCTDGCTFNIPNCLLQVLDEVRTSLVLARINPVQPPFYIKLKSTL